VLFGLVRRAMHSVGERPERADGWAFASALIWLLHPLNTEVVDYVVQRTESLMGLFYLLTIYAAARAIAGERRARRWTFVSIWPGPLVLDYGRVQPITFSAALPYAIVVVTLLVAALAAWIRRPQIAFLGSCFFLTLAPTSSVIPIATEVGAERRMYLPLAALV